MAEKKTSKAKADKKPAAKKSKTPAKTADTKKKGYSATRRAVEQKKKMNPQVKAILLCATGVLFLALVLIKGGAVWLALHRFLFGVFGFCAILVPIVFLYLGIMTAKEKEMAHKGTKIWLSVLIVVMTATLIYLCGNQNYNEGNTYFKALSASYLGSLNPQETPGVPASMCG